MSRIRERNNALSSIKGTLVDGIQILEHLRILEHNYGHVSGRSADRGSMWILGHLHQKSIPITDVTTEHIIEVDIATGASEGALEPPGEVYIHSHIYRNRPDVNAVVHAHPEYPTALSIAGQPVIPAHHHGALFDPSVPLMYDHRQIDHDEIAQEMVGILGDAPAIVLQAHGAVTVGETIEESVINMVTLDACARRQYMAAQVGIPQPIRIPADAERRVPRENVMNEWNFHLAMARR